MTRHRHTVRSGTDRLDTDEGGYTLPPPRKQPSAQQLAPGYLWNGMTQELIPILPEDHPDYAENAETIRTAFRRWKNEKLKNNPAQDNSGQLIRRQRHE
jgi:hypothetical protein